MNRAILFLAVALAVCAPPALAQAHGGGAPAPGTFDLVNMIKAIEGFGKGAIVGAGTVLTPDDLAGLACEDLVEAHLHTAAGREPGPFAAERLRAFGFEVRTGVGGHGVVGVIRGGRPGPLVAFRADAAFDPLAVVLLADGAAGVEGCEPTLDLAQAMRPTKLTEQHRHELPGTSAYRLCVPQGETPSCARRE